METVFPILLDALLRLNGLDILPSTTSFPLPHQWTCSETPAIRRAAYEPTHPPIDFVAVADPTVIRNPLTGLFHMYYTCVGGTDPVPRTCLATSQDSRTWVKHPSNPIFTPAPTGWDSWKVETVDVKWDPNHSRFILAYMGYNLDAANPEHYDLFYGDQANGNRTFTFGSIGIATSPDGVHFTRSGTTPVLPLSNCFVEGPQRFDCFAHEGPSLMHEAGRWRMWYGAQGASVNDWRVPVFGIGYAESLDGLTWTKMAQAPLIQGRENEWDATHVLDPSVHKINGSYVMLYSGSRGQKNVPAGGLTGFLDMQIGLAQSPDGVQWSRVGNEPYIKAGATSWASFFLSFPTLIQIGERFKIFFHGIDQNHVNYDHWEIGVCQSRVSSFD